MGGTSTLQSAVLKDDVSTPTSFDLRSWQGLTLVLKTGKEFLTEPGAYAEFRNLVLQYAQQGGDVEIKKQIDAIITTFGKPVAPKLAPASAQIPTPPTVSAVEVKSEESTQSTEKEEVATPKMVGRRPAPRFGTQDTDTPLVTVAITPEVAPQAPDGAVVPVIPDIPKVAEVIPPPIIVEPEPTRSVPKTLEEYRIRIAEIKRAVHEHIGNPVALMGTKDGKGKEYMTALLNALKATGAGAGGGADGAMQTLELAYTDLIETHATATPHTKNAEEDEESTHEKATEEVLEPVHDQPPSTVHAPVTQADVYPETKEEVGETPISQGLVNEETPPQRETIGTSFKQSDSTIAAVVSSVHRNTHSAEDTLATLLGDERSLAPTPVRNEELLQRTPHKEDGEVVAPISGTLNTKSNAKEKELPHNVWSSLGIPPLPTSELTREVGIDLKEVAVKQSELSSPEVSAMLDKLLHEWSIFGGSGLFGIGPGGLAHPLFRKLAPLSMGEVVAGRWEGTDPKIVKVIKQYVDAWRHEQGITFTTNETFEHYLRRVVQRILKRQGGG